MRPGIAFLLSALLAGTATGAVPAGRWRRYSTPDFEVLTTAGGHEAISALAQLQRLRSQLARSGLAIFRPGATPARIVAFSSESEFVPFRSNSYSPAYFVGGLGQPTVVLGRLSKDHLTALAHEYVHAVVRAHTGPLPWWIDEGLAEVVARRDGERARTLSREECAWLLSLQRTSPELENPRSADRAYRLARSLVSALWETHATRASFLDWLDILAGGYDAEQAWDEAFFFPLAELPAKLATLRAGKSFALPAGRGGIFELTANGEPADEEAALLLVDVASRLGRFQPEGAEVAAMGHPPEEAAARLSGWIALRSGQRNEAAALMEHSFDLGCRDERTLWQLAVLLQSRPEPAKLFDVLERLLDVDPAHDDARIVLASRYLAAGRSEDARRHLAALRRIPPGRESYYEQAVAYLAMAPALSTDSR
jgi:tetratricopeptide (TPR) repeat protein